MYLLFDSLTPILSSSLYSPHVIRSWGAAASTPLNVPFYDSEKKKISISKVASGGSECVAITGFLKTILGEDMKSTVNDPTFADVVFIVGSGQAMLRAHRIGTVHECC